MARRLREYAHQQRDEQLRQYAANAAVPMLSTALQVEVVLHCARAARRADPAARVARCSLLPRGMHSRDERATRVLCRRACPRRSPTLARRGVVSE
jgi:hypothetical protein